MLRCYFFIVFSPPLATQKKKKRDKVFFWWGGQVEQIELTRLLAFIGVGEVGLTSKNSLIRQPVGRRQVDNMSANGESSSKVVRSEEEYRRWIQKFSDANDYDAVPLSSDRILLFNSRPRLESLNWGGFCLTNYLMLFFPFFLFSITEVSFRSFVSDTSILEIRRAKPEFLGDTNTPSISSHYYTNWVRLAIILSVCLRVCWSVHLFLLPYPCTSL